MTTVTFSAVQAVHEDRIRTAATRAQRAMPRRTQRGFFARLGARRAASNAS